MFAVCAVVGNTRLRQCADGGGLSRAPDGYKISCLTEGPHLFCLKAQLQLLHKYISLRPPRLCIDSPKWSPDLQNGHQSQFPNGRPYRATCATWHVR